MNNKIAVLIDAENFSAKYTDTVFELLKDKGEIVLKRAYGNFSIPQTSAWKKETVKYAIETVHRFSCISGKNSSDIAFVIDAMDIMAERKDISTFVLATSDSDFVHLVLRLRNAGKKVIGFGSKLATELFRVACDDFFCVDEISAEKTTEHCPKEPTDKKTVKLFAFAKPSVSTAKNVMPIENVKEKIGQYIDQNADESGMVNLGIVGGILKTEIEGFDIKNYGNYKKLADFINDMPEFEIKKDDKYTPPLNMIKRCTKSQEIRKNGVFFTKGSFYNNCGMAATPSSCF